MVRIGWKRAALAALSLFALTPAAAPAAESLKIGAVLSVTGPGSLLGDPEAKVLEYYVNKINGQGGVDGRRIELIVYDDESKAEKAAQLAKRLIASDGVHVILGPSLTGNTMAAVPVVEEFKVPMISIAGGGVIVEPVKTWVFKTPHTDRMASEKVFADMKKRGITRIALIYGTDGYGKSASAATKEIAPKLGMEIVADESYAPSDPDMTAQLTKIRTVPGVQAVFNLGFGQAGAIVTRNYRQLGITLPFYESHGINSRAYIKLAGVDATEGVRLPGSALLVADSLPATDRQQAVTAAFKKEFEDTFRTEVSTYGGHAYDGLMITLAAVKRAGSTDRGKIRDEIEKTAGYVGTSGVVTMSATDHLGLDLSSLKMIEIRKGQWTLID